MMDFSTVDNSLPEPSTSTTPRPRLSAGQEDISAAIAEAEDHLCLARQRSLSFQGHIQASGRPMSAGKQICSADSTQHRSGGNHLSQHPKHLRFPSQ